MGGGRSEQPPRGAAVFRHFDLLLLFFSVCVSSQAEGSPHCTHIPTGQTALTLPPTPVEGKMADQPTYVLNCGQGGRQMGSCALSSFAILHHLILRSDTRTDDCTLYLYNVISFFISSQTDSDINTHLET